MKNELLEYHKLNEIGTYFISLVGYSKGKGSYRIYYNDRIDFEKKYSYIERKLKEIGYKIYKVSKIQKDKMHFIRRVYFRKIERN